MKNNIIHTIIALTFIIAGVVNQMDKGSINYSDHYICYWDWVCSINAVNWHGRRLALRTSGCTEAVN